MKRASFVVVVLLSFATVGGGQGREVINIGPVDVWLGMPEAQIAAAVQSSGGTFTAGGNKGGGTIGGLHSEFFGHVFTQNGKVTRIEREWLVSRTQDTQLGFASALYGAVRSVTDGTTRACAISTDSQREPSYSEDYILLKCPAGNAVKEVKIYAYESNAQLQETWESAK